MYNTSSASIGGMLSLSRNSSMEDFDNFIQSNILELERKMYDMFSDTERNNYLAIDNPEMEITRFREISKTLLSFVTKRTGAENWREYLKYFNSVLAVTSFYTAFDLESPLQSKILLFGAALSYKLINMYVESAVINRDYYRKKYDVYLSAISEAYKKSYISLEAIDSFKKPTSPRAKTIASTKSEILYIFEAFIIALYKAEKRSNTKVENLKEVCLATCYMNLFSAAICYIRETPQAMKLTNEDLRLKSARLAEILEDTLFENMDYMKNKYCWTTYDQDSKFNEKISRFQFMKILSQVYQNGEGMSNKYTDQELINNGFPETVASIENSIKMWIDKSKNNPVPTPNAGLFQAALQGQDPLSARSINSLHSSDISSFATQLAEKISALKASLAKSMPVLSDASRSDCSSPPASMLSSFGFRSPASLSRSGSIDSMINTYGVVNGLEGMELRQDPEIEDTVIQKDAMDYFFKVGKLVRDQSTGRYLLMFTCMGLIISSCFYSISFNVRFNIKEFEKHFSIISGIVAFMFGQYSDGVLESAQKRYNTLQDARKSLVNCLKDGSSCYSRIEWYDSDRVDNKEKKKQIYYVIGATWSMLAHNYNISLDSFYETDIAFISMRMYVAMVRAFEEANSIAFLANVEQLNGIAKNWSDLIYKNSSNTLDVFHPFIKYTVLLNSSLAVDSLYHFITEEIDITGVREKSDAAQKRWGTVLLRPQFKKTGSFFPENEELDVISKLQKTSVEDFHEYENYNSTVSPSNIIMNDSTAISMENIEELSDIEQGVGSSTQECKEAITRYAVVGSYTQRLEQERSGVNIADFSMSSGRCLVM